MDTPQEKRDTRSKSVILDSHSFQTGAFEGWLNKLGSNNKWQRRYFVMDSTKLSYFADDKKKSVKKSIELKETNLLILNEEDYHRSHAFAIIAPRLDRNYVLVGESSQDRLRWAQALQSVGVEERTNAAGICDGHVDGKSLKEEQVEVLEANLTRYYVAVKEGKALHYTYRCDRTPAASFDLSGATIEAVPSADRRLSIQLKAAPAAGKKFVYQFATPRAKSEWLALLTKAATL